MKYILLLQKLFLKYTAGGEVALGVVGFGGTAYDYAGRGRGVYEGEDASGGVGIDHDARVAHGLFVVAPAKEDEVAGLQVAGVGHFDAQACLCAAPAGQVVPEMLV